MEYGSDGPSGAWNKVGSGKAQEERVWTEWNPSYRAVGGVDRCGRETAEVGKMGREVGSLEMVGKRSENGAAFPTSSPVQPAFFHVIHAIVDFPHLRSVRLFSEVFENGLPAEQSWIDNEVTLEGVGIENDSQKDGQDTIAGNGGPGGVGHQAHGTEFIRSWPGFPLGAGSGGSPTI